MILNVTEDNLPFFEALSSEARLRIIQRLSRGDCNIKDLAESLGVSSAITTKHIKKLETAGLIKTNMVKKNGSIQKICTLLNVEYRLCMPVKKPEIRSFYTVSLPVGHFTDFDIEPTCGIASEEKIIGFFDDPKYFLDTQRMEAQIIWFSKGYVEYKFANYLHKSQKAVVIEISMEISSEAPGYNDNWPSDISFILNGTKLCQWTSPGDFGNSRGVLTPSWWEVNQYGVLKTIRITENGVFLDGEKKGYLTLDNINLAPDKWSLRLENSGDAKNVGGLTLYGKKFGNYSQDILITTYYEKVAPAE